MKKRFFGSLLFGALTVFSASVFVSCADYDDDINANKAEIAAAQKDLASLKSSLSSLETSLKAEQTALQQQLETTKSEYQTKIAEAKAELEKAISTKADQSTVDALATRVANLESEMAAKVAAIEAKIASIESSLSDLRKLIEANSANISSLQSTVTTLQNAVANLEKNVVDFATKEKLESEIKALNTALTTLKEALEKEIAAKADAATTQAKLEALEKAITDAAANLNSKIADLQATINSQLEQIQKKIEDGLATKAEKTAFDALQANFNELKATVDTMKGQITDLQTLVNSKASQAALEALTSTVTTNYTELKAEISKLVTPEQMKAAIDAAIATLKAQLETAIKDLEAKLQKEIDGKVNQADFDAEKLKIQTLQTQVLALQNSLETQVLAIQAALALKVDQSQFDQYKEQIEKELAALREQVKKDIDNLRDQVTAMLDSKADKTQVIALQNALDKLADVVATKADITYVDEQNANMLTIILGLAADMQTADKALKDSIDNVRDDLSAALLLTTIAIADEMEELETRLNITIQNNYSFLLDSIRNVAATVAAIESNLTGLDGQVKKHQQRLDSIVTALLTKVNSADVAALIGKANTRIDSVAAITTALKTQDAAILAFLGNIEGGTLKGKLDELYNKMSTEAKAALEEEIAARKNGLDSLSGVTSAIISDLASLSGYVGKLDSMYAAQADSFAVLQGNFDSFKQEMTDKLTQMDQDVAKYQQGLNDIQLLVQKMLTSITLMPELYINGIEAIQFTSVLYYPQEFIPTIIPYEYADAEGWTMTATLTATHNAKTVVNRWKEPFLSDTSTVTLLTEGSSPAFDDEKNFNGDARTFRPKMNIIDHQLQVKNYAIKNGKETYADSVVIDNGLTKAEYRLSPANVSLDEIDVDGIKLWGKHARTIERTRAAEVYEDSPVYTDSVELNANGNLTVYLRKKAAVDIAYPGEDANDSEVWLTSLMVPRKANEEKGIKAADIYSEFSLIDEEVITPRIAALNNYFADGVKKGTYRFSNSSSLHYWHNPEKPTQYHYIDSLHIWKSKVDLADGNHFKYGVYVKEEIPYDTQGWDLLQLVTGCYEDVNGVHQEITKLELSKYGLAFRFALPTTPYATPGTINLDYTDQQKFAQINGSLINAKLPKDLAYSGNQAVIGKEPIVRVMLMDTVKNNLVDQAYFKVKFVDTTPDKDPINVTFEREATLRCDSNRMVIPWIDFIQEVYAKIPQEDGVNPGMSWNDFRAYYPKTEVVRTYKTYTEDKIITYFDGKKNYATSYEPAKSPLTAKYNNGLEVKFTDKGEWIEQGVVATTHQMGIDSIGKVYIWWLANSNPSEHADANELWWVLGEEEIGTIPTDTRQKSFETKVTFKSAQPKIYGDIIVTLKYTINLPTTPQIVGYNDNQWFEKQEKFYVKPVQYGTSPSYKTGKLDKVEYDFNLIQQFTVTNYPSYDGLTINATDSTKAVAAGTWQNWIVKGMPTFTGKDKAGKDSIFNCGSWDIQFRLQQHQSPTLYYPQYAWLSDGEIGRIGDFNTVICEPQVTSKKMAAMEAYKLIYDKKNASSNDSALEIHWVKDAALNADHYSWTNWDSDDKYQPYAILHGDTNNVPYIIPLLNPLSTDNESDGWTPKFTNNDNKAVDLAVFAKYNKYNTEVIKSFKAYLVEPIRIETTIAGVFEDNYISGTQIDGDGGLRVTDFKGYLVAMNPFDSLEIEALAKKYPNAEPYSYPVELWNYYGLDSLRFDTDSTKVKYGLKMKNGNLVVDQNATAQNAMTADAVAKQTAGAYKPSLIYKDGKLIYYNQTGRQFDTWFNCFIPVSVKHAFGEMSSYVTVRVYPNGKAAGDGFEVVPGPGPLTPARMR